MTEEDLRNFLTTEKDAIAAAIRDRAITAMTQSISYQLPQSVTKAVEDFFEAEIVPEIKKSLTDQKGVIVEASIKAAAVIGDKVSEALVKKAVETMSGYRSDEVIKALMGCR